MIKSFVRSAYGVWRTPRIQTLILIVVLAMVILTCAVLAIRMEPAAAVQSGVPGDAAALIQFQTSRAQIVLGLGAAGIAAFIAIWGVVNQWAMSRRQLTIQFLRELETDHDYLKALKSFLAAIEETGDVGRYARPMPAKYTAPCFGWRDRYKVAREQWQQTSSDITLVLNQDELIAIGIKSSILDYRVVAAYQRGSMIRRYQECKDYIHLIRTVSRQPTLYVELERLACRLIEDDFHALL